MANKFGLQLGDWVKVSCHSNGGISFDGWNPTGKVVEGKIVGFEPGGCPLLYLPNAPERSGAWAVGDHNKGHFGIDSAFQKEIPTGVSCMIQTYTETSIQRVGSSAPITKIETDKLIMKHNLKVGDRVVVSMAGGASKPSAYAWSKTNQSAMAGVVVGAKGDGSPIVYFDSNPGYSFMWDWTYHYGSDYTAMDPQFHDKVNLTSKRCWHLEEHTAFVLEADYKAGKLPKPKAMPLKTAWDSLGCGTGATVHAADARDFIEHLGAQLRSDETTFLYGDQFRELFSKQVPMNHQVFCATTAAMTTFAGSLRNNFGESAVIHNGVIDSNNPDVIVNEYVVKWKNRDTVPKMFKVHMATPANASVKSPFQKGGVDVSAFQMFGPASNYLIKNFATEDFDAAYSNIIKKQFVAFGDANKAAIEELIRKGFSAQGKIDRINKEIKNMDSKSEKTASFAEMMKEDFKKATYRVAADQMTHGIKEGIVALIGSKGGTESQMSGMMILLDSEIGEAAIAMLAGLGLTYAPVVSEDPRAQKLAGEFRVNGMAKAGNVLVENLLGTFLPIVQKALASLPAEEQVRVETTTNARIAAPAVKEEEHEEEAAVSSGKKAVA